MWFPHLNQVRVCVDIVVCELFQLFGRRFTVVCRIALYSAMKTHRGVVQLVNDKEQKVSLFRRLFGMENSEEVNPNEKADIEENSERVSSLKVKSTVYPDAVQENVESLPEPLKAATEPGIKSKQPEVQVVETTAQRPGVGMQAGTGLNQRDTDGPTWEELLNKIAPPVSPAVDKRSEATTVSSGTGHFTLESQEAKSLRMPWDGAEVGSAELPWDKREAGSTIEAETNRAEAQVVTEPERSAETVQTQIVASKAREGSEQISAVPPAVEQELLITSDEEIDPQVLPQETILPQEKAPIQNEQVTWLLQQAEEIASKGELEKAEKLLEVAFALEHHPDVLLALAKHETLAGNLEKAVNFGMQSIELYADSAEAVALLSRLAALGANLDPDRLAALNPGSANCCLELAKLCLSSDYLTQAQNLFAKAQARGVNLDDLRADLGCLCERLGDTSQAKEHYCRELELRRNPSVARRLFDIYLSTDSYFAAEELAAVHFVGELEPETVQRLARLNLVLGKSLLDKRELDNALDKFTASLQMGNEDAKGWVVSTLCSIAEQKLSIDPSAAQEYLEEALKLGGDEFEITGKLIASYSNSGNDSKALELLQNLHAQEPENREITLQLVKALQKTGEMDRAVELLETLVSTGAVDQDTRELLFNYYRSQGRFEEARRQLKALYSPGSEGFEAGLQSLVWEEIRFMVEQGDFTKAWEVCSAELRAKPTAEVLGMGMKILSQRVDALAVENKVNEALEALEEGRTLGFNVLDLGLQEAALYESIGNDRAALSVYEAIAKKAPEVWGKIKELYLKAATREYLAGNLTEAKKLLEDAYAKLPKNEEVCRALGVLYQETGQFALAAALARDSMEENEIQVPTDHLNVLRPHSYRRIRLG